MRKGAATVDGIPGTAVMTVSRGGGTRQIDGFFWPEDEAGLQTLHELFDDGSLLTYEGPLANGPASRIRVKVKIGRITFGQERRVVLSAAGAPEALPTA